MGRQPEESTVPRPVASPPADSVDRREVTPAPKDAPAQLGRYELLFLLARGGMGTVHVGRLRGAHGFDRLVAIKRLSATGASHEEIASFLAEARLTARLSHPNVVQTLDLGEHEGSPFLVMQLVQGISLARLLRRLAEDEAALEPELAAWICAQASLGLHAAHELEDAAGRPLDLVHRDVSPENLLLSWEGRVYVADFGVAKFADQDRATKSGVVKGKFAYMSPEQTRAGALDRRSDVFSLGVLLHESLTGRRLFAGDSPADTIRRIVEVEPVDPATLRPDVPAAISEVALRCLSKKPGDRPATAAEVADALRRALREGRAMVDESDVAALLDRYFADERRRLRDRLRAAAGDEGAHGTPRGAPEGAGEEGGGTVSVAGRSSEHGSVTAAIGSAPVRSRRIASTTAVVGLACALGVGWWVLASRTSPSPVAADAASAPVPPPSASPAEAHAQSTAAAASATAAPAVSASVAQPAPPPVEIRRVVAPRPGAKPSLPAAPPPPAAPAPAPSHGGVPFRDL